LYTGHFVPVDNVIEHDKQRVTAAVPVSTAIVNWRVLTMAAAAASTQSTPSSSPLLASLPSLATSIAVSVEAESTRLYSQDYGEKLLIKFPKEIQSEYFGQGQNLSIEGKSIVLDGCSGQYRCG